MNDMFTVDDFTDVVKFVLNRPYETFKSMYVDLGFIGEIYIQENYDKARFSFTSWWCDLDTEVQIAVIKWVKNFYGHIE